MATPTPKTPTLMFFKEVQFHDISKLKRQSNISRTGGGARDLRIPQELRRIMEEFFPDSHARPGVRQGKIYWDDQNSVHDTTITFWPPTDARPNEDRIAQIWRIDGWVVDESEWKADKAKGKRWFFLLVKDKDGIVWARLLYESNLANEDARIQRYVERRIREQKRNVSILGSFNFQTGEEFP